MKQNRVMLRPILREGSLPILRELKMKKLPPVIILLTVFFLASSANGALGTFVGLETLRKIIILNRVDAEDRGGEKGDTARSRGTSNQEDSRDSKGVRSDAIAHFETLLFTRGTETAQLNAEIGFGDFSIEPASDDTLIYLTVDYDADVFPSPIVNHRRENGHLTITLESTESIDEDINLDDSHSIHNTWCVRLGRKVIWSLQLQLAYCETHLELGGLKVEELSVESGLSETQLSFSEPNVIVLQRCDIETGLGSFEAVRLGNAAMRRFTLENGLGSSILDFRGCCPRENLRAVIESGLGSVEMQLPNGLPVMMQVEATLGSTDLPGFHQMNGGLYRSIPYIEGVPGLEADVSVGLGSVNVIWVSDEKSTLPLEKPPMPPKPPKK